MGLLSVYLMQTRSKNTCVCGRQNIATKQVTRTPEQSDQVDHLMSCQSREKPGSCPKQKSTIMRTPGYGSKMIRPLGYRMIRIMIYALLTCHNWGEK